MRYINKTLLILFLSFGVILSALIDPQLLSILEKASPSEKIPVDFALKERVSALKLDPTIENLPRPQRRARVGRVLMDFAERTQRDLLNYLRQKEREGKVSNIVSLWIVNLVGCLATPDVISEVANRTDVEYVLYAKVPVELSPIKEVVPKDITETIQPNLARINARGAWKQGYTGQNIVIGVVDTGVRYTHLDLRNHLWQSPAYPNCGFNVASYQMNFGHQGPSPYDTLTPLDFYGHGTHCAGITSADGSYGNGTRDTMGVAPSALIMSVPVDVYVHSPYPDTSLEKSTWFGIQFCVRPPRDTLNGADVITMSLGLVSTWMPRRRLHREVEENVLAAGIVHCVAAGNEGSSKLRVPGNCPPPYPHPQNVGTGAPSAVISVGATDNNDNIASFSSLGPTRVWDTVPPWYDYSPYLMDPDVCAPGVNILSTYYSSDQSYTTMSGTSMATPHVAGLVALMLSKNPSLTPRQIDSIIERHGVVDLGITGKDTVFGSGRINCSLAVALTPPPNNVGVTKIEAPTGTIDSGGVIIPACSVYNYASATVSYPVRMKIGNFYNQTATVSSHAPGTYRYVTFPVWNVTQKGTHAVSCSTELNGDFEPGNDKQTGSVTVRVRDVGVVSLLAPAGTIDSLTAVTPACSVYNFGTTTEGPYLVRMKVGNFYNQTASVSTHNPGERLYLEFPPLSNWPRGTHPVTCSTELSGDLNLNNDKMAGSVTVDVRDVGTISIVQPVGTLDSTGEIIPKARVKNFGTTTESFTAKFSIGGWSSTKSVSDLTPSEEREIEFDPWLVSGRGNYTARCSTELSGDMNSGNDKASGSFSVRVRDCGIVSFVIPYDNMPVGEYNPRVRFTNFGTEIANFTARIRIGDYVGNATINNLYPGITITSIFEPVWTATVGNWTAVCSLYYEGDLVPGNNTLSLDFKVRPLYVGWVRMADLNGSKSVKSGGCITALDSSIYALIGNNTFDLLRYSIEGNSWAKVSDVPSGPKGKRVKKGACITNDGQYLYVIKGNNTKEFYRYHPEDGKWDTLPEPNFTKGIKGGFITKLGDYLYLGSGSSNNEWQRFNLTSGQWENCEPATLPQDKFKVGSAIASYPDTLLYLLRVGGKTNEFYALNLNRSPLEWERKNDLPLVGRESRKKKVKEGGSLVYADIDRKLYALKGGNTYEFWQYNPLNDSWYQKEDVGQPNGTPGKKLKAGASLTYSRYVDFLYSTIGNNTNEFWLYGGPFTVVSSLPLTSVMNSASKETPSLQINANPAKGPIKVFYSLPKREVATLRIYNCLGEVVYNAKSEQGVFIVDRLPAGIYLLRLSAKGYKVERKLIVVK